MLFSFIHTPQKIRFQIESFTRIRPIPQLDAWQAFSQALYDQHYYTESAVVLDIAANIYTKSAVRKIAAQVLSVPSSRRGRGLITCDSPLQHPAVYDLRDHNAPVMFDGYVGFRVGSTLQLIHPITADTRIINPFSPNPRQFPQNGISEPWIHIPISYINLHNHLIFSPQTDELYVIDLNSIDFTLSPMVAEKQILPFARIQCGAPIHRICGPLDDGTFFVTLAPDFAALSDKCFLYQLDISKIQSAIHAETNTCFQLRDVAQKIIQLSNIEQTLNNDICTSGNLFITCSGGMQPEEVRFIYTDGSWTARCVHTSPVIRILQTVFGPVSLDSEGQAFLWNDEKIVGDMQFDLKKYKTLLQSPTSICSLDWQTHKLYLTEFDDYAHLTTALSKSNSVCIGATDCSERPFVQKMLYLPDCTIAMLSDGNYYFWDSAYDCVLPPWQLSQKLADAEDWREVLSIPSPALEQDPRIRMI